MTVGEIIRKRRKACHLTLSQLGDAVGVSKQTVQRYESGVITNIPGDKIQLMAKALSTTPSALMGWEDLMDVEGGNLRSVHRTRLPLLGQIACGKPIYAEEEYEGDVMIDSQMPKADFCLIAKGNSMEGARIFDGDAVFIRSQDSVDNGEIAAVVIEEEATLKRVYYYPRQQKLVLSPENKDYEPLVYIGSELDQVRILGLAVAFQSRVR